MTTSQAQQKLRKSSTPGGDSLLPESGAESGGSPVTVLHVEMEDGSATDDGSIKQGEAGIEISTQTERPSIDDKETMMTNEEVEGMATTETECRETQV